MGFEWNFMTYFPAKMRTSAHGFARGGAVVRAGLDHAAGGARSRKPVRSLIEWSRAERADVDRICVREGAKQMPKVSRLPAPAALPEPPQGIGTQLDYTKYVIHDMAAGV
jgi:hypothetical protein